MADFEKVSEAITKDIICRKIDGYDWRYVARNCVDQNIPVKAHWNEDGIACPVCRENMDYDANIKYCAYCGQRIQLRDYQQEELKRLRSEFYHDV